MNESIKWLEGLLIEGILRKNLEDLSPVEKHFIRELIECRQK